VGCEAGSSLVEVLVAAAILVTVFAGLAQLFVYTGRFTRDSSRREVAVLAAQSKIEWLRARTFAYGAGGTLASDPALEPSPEEALVADVHGYHDLLDMNGIVMAGDGGESAPAFVRRWAIRALDDGPDAMAIEVCVYRWPAGETPVTGAEICLATIRARQP
jgi:hypothetical protein